MSKIKKIVNSGKVKHPKKRDIQQILDEIRNYKESIRPDLTEAQIIDLVGEMEPYFPLGAVNWPNESVFYRARQLSDTNYQELENWDESDFWEVPERFVNGYGRLNRPQESVFYLSTDFNQTLKEIRYNQKFPVVVSRFETKRPFTGIRIGQPSYNGITNELTKEEQSGGILFSDFFKDEFSKPVGKGTEFLYRESVAIADTYYSVPFKYAQAYTYPAVDNTPDVMNVAFKNKNAHEFLEYTGSVAFQGYENNEMDLFCIFDDDYIAHKPSNYAGWLNEKFDLSI
ncbi:hypothetical protein [Lentilactobacillus sp. SPB1-3]|uniref:Uncharacterized protein n=1 Tax=Lentilactobacillus terminaliae TaxID=3003483 RepID=A0ACD5DG66_9LACO|nr:hypothetical protein [Lentilactobacillus sp. SPB1-3]MCZ0976675.1 hypothetical protein [Lentilactobacillus sp. SPB1-3]